MSRGSAAKTDTASWQLLLLYLSGNEPPPERGLIEPRFSSCYQLLVNFLNRQQIA
jgi:hypothetical protein